MRTLRRLSLLCATAIVASAATAHAALLTFNATAPANNAATRAAWLAAIGIGAPQHLVDFETGFTSGQNISGVPGLFPDGFLIDDTSTADQVIVRSGASVIGGSNPVGVFSATHNEATLLRLDFSARPVDYVALLDIDQAGTSVVVRLEDGTTANFNLDTTGSGGNVEEFYGIFRNDQPRIVRVDLDASGDGRWGIDNIEYGRIPQNIPEPATIGVLGLGLLGVLRRRARS